MRVYFDVCALNRPFDDQSQDRIRLEADAVRIILMKCRAGDLDWVTSGAVSDEIGQNPDPVRQAEVVELSQTAPSRCDFNATVRDRANHLSNTGLRAMDALHLAYAEAAGCDILFSTDDRFIHRAERLSPPSTVRVMNPLAWVLSRRIG